MENKSLPVRVVPATCRNCMNFMPYLCGSYTGSWGYCTVHLKSVYVNELCRSYVKEVQADER